MSTAAKCPAILGIGAALPRYAADQQAIGRWMAASFANRPAVQRLIRSLYALSGIETRHSCIPTYLKPVEESPFAPGRSVDESPTTAERMAIYSREAPPLAAQAARQALADYAAAAQLTPDAARDSITHLMVVSCTGFFAPGLDFVLARDLGLAPTVERAIIGFMGCSAAFNGMRTAARMVAGRPDARVLVVSVELCSLHIQPGTVRDNLVSASLFADGASACVIGAPQETAGDHFLLQNFHTGMKPATEDEMVWHIGDHGFTLRLSPKIPDHLAQVAPDALAQLFSQGQPGFWAIHPGGRAIVDRLQEIFELDDEAIASSRGVLRDVGNLSSATILFVLARTRESLRRQVNARRNGVDNTGPAGVAMAFGPGLVVEMMRLAYVPARATHVAPAWSVARANGAPAHQPAAVTVEQQP